MKCSTIVLLIFALFLPTFAFGGSAKSVQDVASYIQKGEYEKAVAILESELKKKPSDNNLRRMLFQCYFQLGVKRFQANELSSAGDWFYKALQLDPSSLPARQNLALVLFKLGNLDEAKRVIEEGLKTTPPDRNLLLILAQIYQQEGAMDKVISTLEEIHKHYPKDKEVGTVLGRIYYSQFKLEEARRIYQDLAKEYPDEVEILLTIAKIYEDEGKSMEALSEYEKVLKIEPKNLNIYRRMVKIYEKESKIDEGIEVYERAEKVLPGVGELYMWLGELWEKKGDENSALVNYGKAVELSIEHPLPYFRLASKAEDPKERQRLLKLAVHKGVRILERMEQSLLMGFEEGTSIERLRGSLELAEEIEKIEKTLRSALDAYLFPPSASGTEEAEKELQNLLKRYPDSRLLLEYVGAILEKRGEWDRALEIWTKILKRNARVQRAHLGMGKAYEAKGELEEARKAYRRALELKEEDEEAFQGLVRVSERLGKLDELVREWDIRAKFSFYRSNPLFLSRYEGLLRKVGRKEEADQIREKLEELRSQEK